MTKTDSCPAIFSEHLWPVATVGILAAMLLLWLAGPLAGAEPARRPPNVLWLIAENMGPDLTCYGAKHVVTPNLDRLAAQGMRFTRVFATSPVCSPSRSAFMTGMYQTTIGAHHHRSHRTPGVDDRFQLPAGVQPVTHWLIDAGYYTANVITMDGRWIGTGKTDLNFEVQGRSLPPGEPSMPKGTQEWARQNFTNSVRLFHTADWAALKEHQPFFAQINFPAVERNAKGWVGQDQNPKHADPAQVALPPYYPDTPAVRQDWAGYLDAVSGLDVQVGRVLKRLEEDGLADNTVVIFFGDNGRLEARGLDWCYDSGLHVPLIIRWPKGYPVPSQYEPGRVSDRLVSLIDVTATTLAIAGLQKPEQMHGRIFLGPGAEPPREYVFGARDRTDDAVQRIRTVRSARYRYIRNFMPDKPFLAPHTYKEANFPVYAALRQCQADGTLTPAQATLTAPRLPDEELYDTQNDPHEIHNLVGSTDHEHQRILKELRAELDRWLAATDDQGRFPEPPEVIEYWKTDAHSRHGNRLKQP